METQFTLLLQDVADGDRDAANRLFSLVYHELRQIAENQMIGENQGITHQATALVHDVWIKLIGNQDAPEWNSRVHFFAAAAQAMRRILVDAARSRNRKKRGSGKAKFSIDENDLVSCPDDELLALNEALESLAVEHPRKAELVSLRFFGGLTNSQASEHLGISTATAERDWTFAKAWLRSQMDAGD